MHWVQNPLFSSGGFGVLWSLIWFAIIHNSPRAHPRISQQEKEYIIKSIGLDKPKDKVCLNCLQWIKLHLFLSTHLINLLNSALFSHLFSNWCLMIWLQSEILYVLLQTRSKLTAILQRLSSLNISLAISHLAYLPFRGIWVKRFLCIFYCSCSTFQLLRKRRFLPKVFFRVW